MATQAVGPNVKYVADVSHVREVSLLGTADADYWKRRLRGEGLVPTELDGKAQVLLIAADMKFMGLRFQELSFSVLVNHHEAGVSQDASFLVCAFNTRRLFAFCERAFFSTPYYHGDVRTSAAFPPSMRLLAGGEAAFAAEMKADAPREPSRAGEDGWDGTVYLPGAGGDALQGKLFYAKLSGDTRTYPCLPSDVVTIRPPRQGVEGDVLQALSDSHFVGREWVVRQDARHAKSKTYRRADRVSRG